MPNATRVSHDGLVWISGNYYSIPDHTRRSVEVQQLPDVIPFSIKRNRCRPSRSREGRRRTRVAPEHRQAVNRSRSRPGVSEALVDRAGDHMPRRSLGVTEVSQAPPPIGRPAITIHAQPAAIDSVKKGLVALNMPGALRMTPRCGGLKEGEVTWIEALETLIEELTVRDSRGVSTAVRMSRLTTVKKARWLRLRIPARSQSHSGACPIEIHLLATPARAISRRHSRSRP
ncbi:MULTISPECIES: hypothetical protein [unclassified Bradyrhizobium]|uniref:hypothetical protein n=2 Tax=Bradyrhizobium TaxID=374 RepID=UPI0023DF73DE|nr:MULTISPECIES: hypothetical protein [unclassified Bradyrhizobium]